MGNKYYVGDRFFVSSERDKEIIGLKGFSYFTRTIRDSVVFGDGKQIETELVTSSDLDNLVRTYSARSALLERLAIGGVCADELNGIADMIEDAR